jgi:hypothetical protein
MSKWWSGTLTWLVLVSCVKLGMEGVALLLIQYGVKIILALYAVLILIKKLICPVLQVSCSYISISCWRHKEYDISPV